MKYKVYILKSCKKETYYIGCTTDIIKRLDEHNKGRTRSTKPYRPWKVLHIEEFSNKQDAYRRERHLKHPKGYLEKLEIIKKYGRVA